MAKKRVAKKKVVSKKPEKEVEELRPSRFKNDTVVTITEIQYVFDTPKSTVMDVIKQAGVEPLPKLKASSRYYYYEVVNGVVNYQADTIKRLRAPKKPQKTADNLSPLEKSRMLQLDIKNSILQRKWAPIDLLRNIVSEHNRKCRMIMSSIRPMLRRKYAEEIPIEALQDIESELVKIMDQVSELTIEDSDFEFTEQPSQV